MLIVRMQDFLINERGEIVFNISLRNLNYTIVLKKDHIMFNYLFNAFFLEEKRKLITELISTYNELYERHISSASSMDTLEQTTNHKKLIESRDFIKRLNRPSDIHCNQVLLGSQDDLLRRTIKDYKQTVDVHIFLFNASILFFVLLVYLSLSAFIPFVGLTLLMIPAAYIAISTLLSSLLCIAAVIAVGMKSCTSHINIKAAFDPAELEKFFPESAIDQLLGSLELLDWYTVHYFIELYPVQTVKKLFTDLSDATKIFDVQQAQLQHLPLFYLNRLSQSMPSVTMFRVSQRCLQEMSHEQLIALAKVIPNSRVEINDRVNGGADEKLNFLKLLLNKNIKIKASRISKTLFALETQNQPYLPDIMMHVAGFFHQGDLIRSNLREARAEEQTKHSGFSPV